MNTINNTSEILRKLQTRLQKTFCHMYLYFFKEIGNDELPVLKNSLSYDEIDLFNEEAKASLVRTLIYIRTFFDSGPNDLSLFNLYKDLIVSELIKEPKLINLFKNLKDANGNNKSKEHTEIRNQIITHILGEDCSKELSKILKVTNKKIAHIDKLADAKITYDDIEKLAFRIEKILCRELSTSLNINDNNRFDHTNRKEKIKKYLTRLYLTEKKQN